MSHTHAAFFDVERLNLEFINHEGFVVFKHVYESKLGPIDLRIVHMCPILAQHFLKHFVVIGSRRLRTLQAPPTHVVAKAEAIEDIFPLLAVLLFHSGHGCFAGHARPSTARAPGCACRRRLGQCETTRPRVSAPWA